MEYRFLNNLLEILVLKTKTNEEKNTKGKVTLVIFVSSVLSHRGFFFFFVTNSVCPFHLLIFYNPLKIFSRIVSSNPHSMFGSTKSHIVSSHMLTESTSVQLFISTLPSRRIPNTEPDHHVFKCNGERTTWEDDS